MTPSIITSTNSKRPDEQDLSFIVYKTDMLGNHNYGICKDLKIINQMIGYVVEHQTKIVSIVFWNEEDGGFYRLIMTRFMEGKQC